MYVYARAIFMLHVLVEGAELTRIAQRPRSLDSFSWYASLYQYSRPTDDAEEDEPELGPDGDLVSAMITTALIPRFCLVIEGGGLDPYSAKDIRRLIDLAEEIEVSVDKQNQKFEVSLAEPVRQDQGLRTDAMIVAAPEVCTHRVQRGSHRYRGRARALPRAQPASVRPAGYPCP